MREEEIQNTLEQLDNAIATSSEWIAMTEKYIDSRLDSLAESKKTLARLLRERANLLQSLEQDRPDFNGF